MIYHIWQEGKSSEDTKRRNALARQTWLEQYRKGWIERRIPEGALPRTADKMYKREKRNLPFIKDIIRQGCVGLKDNETIVFTNADTCMSPILTECLLGAFQSMDAIHCHRRDFKALQWPLNAEEIEKGEWYPGTDLFAMKVGFWRGIQADFPDMITGAEAWDKIMRELLIKSGAGELYNMIYHEQHNSYWSTKENKMTSPANVHNRTLAREWLQANNLPLAELNFKETHKTI